MPRIVDQVAACCPTDAVGIGFLGSVGCNNTEIRHFSSSWNGRWVAENHGVGAFRIVSCAAVAEAGNFFGTFVDPFGCVHTIAMFSILL